jgi:hypothetical protein
LVARDIDPRLIVEVEKVEVGEPDVADDAALVELGDVAILDEVSGNAMGSDAPVLLNTLAVLLNIVAVLLNDVAVLELDCCNEQIPIST